MSKNEIMNEISASDTPGKLAQIAFLSSSFFLSVIVFDEFYAR